MPLYLTSECHTWMHQKCWSVYDSLKEFQLEIDKTKNVLTIDRCETYLTIVPEICGGDWRNLVLDYFFSFWNIAVNASIVEKHARTHKLTLWCSILRLNTIFLIQFHFDTWKSENKKTTVSVSVCPSVL